jgi:3-carboxy-cis,cis-muconate cycloisomerase
LIHTQLLLEGLEVHPETMRKNLDITHGAIASEAVMMVLGKKVGRQVAHDLVYDICRKMATDPTQVFVECLLENKVVKQCGISRKDLESLCDPGKYIGLCAEMASSVVANKPFVQAKS